MVTKEEKRRAIIDEIDTIRDNGAALQVELGERNIQGLTEAIKDQVEDKCRGKIWEYLEV